MREISNVGVVGLGTMGAGIVEVFTRAGLAVVAVEVGAGELERGQAIVAGSTGRAVAKGRLTSAKREALLSRVTFTTDLTAVHDADLVIEAVPERLDLKRELFARLDAVCAAHTILATNTSSLSVTEIAVATRRANQVIGMHFFNPAPVMKLVEVVTTVVTDADVATATEALCVRLGKVDVTIGDRAGFIANRLLFGYLNQAVGMYESGFVSREGIDGAMTSGCGLPMGPLALLDLIGLDTGYEILETIYRQGGRDRRHAPVPLLGQMVTAGLLGRKSGRGFYTYREPGSSEVVPDDLTPRTAKGEAGDPNPPVATIGVVGSGVAASVAGSGVAASVAGGVVEVFATAGYPVTAVSWGAEEAAGLREAVETSLAAAVVRGTLTAAQRDAALGRITWSVALEQVSDVDLVVEAVSSASPGSGAQPSDDESIFAALGQICKPGAILATTAEFPVIERAMASRRPESVVGLRFHHPAPARGVVEVVHTVRTSPGTLATARAVCASAGAHVVVCPDRSGFVIDALLFPYLNDAIKMLETSYANVDDIDAAMTLGCGYPVGPFELLDTVGLDGCLAAQRRLYHELREPGLAPAALLDHMVTAGFLGREVGRGFRDYHRA